MGIAKGVDKGDAKSLLIAAASILAKTSRDAYCMEMDAKYPGYGFAQHKGYPTEAHFSALRSLHVFIVGDIACDIEGYSQENIGRALV